MTGLSVAVAVTAWAAVIVACVAALILHAWRTLPDDPPATPTAPTSDEPPPTP